MKPAPAWNGELVIEIDGRERVLRPSIRAAMDIETMAGLSLVAIAGEFENGHPRITSLSAILAACLNAGGTRSAATLQPYTLEEVGALILSGSQLAAWIEIAAALIAHLLSGGQAGRAALGEASRSVRSGLLLRIDGSPASLASGPATGAPLSPPLVSSLPQPTT